MPEPNSDARPTSPPAAIFVVVLTCHLQSLRRGHVAALDRDDQKSQNRVCGNRPGLWMVSDGLQIVLDAVQITLDPLQITLDGLHSRENILEGLLVRACKFVLRAVRDDGTSGELCALIGVPYC